MDPIFIARERSLYQASTGRTLQTRQRNLAQLREQMSTGLEVNRPSDDPSSFSQARKMELLSDRYEHYQRSINSAQTWVDSTQQALDELVEFFTEAYERGIRISNDTFSVEDRETFAQRIDFILKNVPDQLNSKSGDEYLFAGSRSTIKPFVVSSDPLLIPDTADIAYLGSPNDPTGVLGSRTRHIAPGIKIDIATNGEQVWRIDFDKDGINDGPNDFTLTEALSELATAVRSGDHALLETALEHVGAARDHVIELTAKSGDMASRLNVVSDQLHEASILLEERRSFLEDADMAEVITKINMEQAGLQATLQVAAKIMQTTLLDYLR